MSVVIGEFPGGSVVKNLPASAGDGDSIPGLERSSLKFEEMATQYLCLENPLDRGAWKATAHGSAKSWMHKKTCTIWW